MHVFHLKDLATPTHPEIALTLQRWRRANNSGEHRHDGVEIVFVLSGSGVNFLDGRPFPIIAGDLYVVNRGAVHSFYSNNELIFYNLLFSFSLFSRREQEEFRRIPEFERVFAAALTRGAGFDKLSLPPAGRGTSPGTFRSTEPGTAHRRSRQPPRGPRHADAADRRNLPLCGGAPLPAGGGERQSPLPADPDHRFSECELPAAARPLRTGGGGGPEPDLRRGVLPEPHRNSAGTPPDHAADRRGAQAARPPPRMEHHRNRRPVRIRRLRLLHPGVPRRDRGDSHAISEKIREKL